MVWLVFETFVVMLVFVASGIVLGIGLKHLFGGAGEPVAAGAGVRTVPATERPAMPVPRPAPAPAPAAADVPGADAAPADGAVLTATETVIDPAKAAAADQVGARPAAFAGPRDGVPDDLKRIKGIGPQNEARLNALGIFHFDQIAGWTAEESRWVGSYLAFPGRIEREDWVGQARGLGGQG